MILVGDRRYYARRCRPARWSTTLSSKVNLPHVIDFRALCVANLVTYPQSSGGTKSPYSTEWWREGKMSFVLFVCV